MVTIRHFLKDGTQVDSIEGRVVSYEDCPTVYDLINRINQSRAKEAAIHNKEGKQDGDDKQHHSDGRVKRK